jgi:hypothetical protein
LRGRLRNKRLDKYVEHRNTIVQIEHELIPARKNMGNNIRALEDAVKQFKKGAPRLILRMYETTLSTGLSLKIVNLELINDYAELYILLKKINSDIDYLNQLVENIQMRGEKGKEFISLITAYEKLIEYLLKQCKKADNKILLLIAKCQIVLDYGEEEKSLKRKYINDGQEIEYNFSERDIQKKKDRVTKQESRPYADEETPDEVFMLYLDVQLVRLPQEDWKK